MKNNVLNALHLSEVSYVGCNVFDMNKLTVIWKGGFYG